MGDGEIELVGGLKFKLGDGKMKMGDGKIKVEGLKSNWEGGLEIGRAHV